MKSSKFGLAALSFSLCLTPSFLFANNFEWLYPGVDRTVDIEAIKTPLQFHANKTEITIVGGSEALESENFYEEAWGSNTLTCRGIKRPEYVINGGHRFIFKKFDKVLLTGQAVVREAIKDSSVRGGRRVEYTISISGSKLLSAIKCNLIARKPGINLDIEAFLKIFTPLDSDLDRLPQKGESHHHPDQEVYYNGEGIFVGPNLNDFQNFKDRS